MVRPLRPLVAVRGECLPWPSAKTSPVESPAAARCESSHEVCIARPPPSAGRSPGIVGARSIVPTQSISRPPSQPCGPSRVRLATHSELQQMVASKLMQDWSPQQVSGWLKMEYPNDESLRVSHETIYRSLFLQARGALMQELVRHLRSQRRIRRSRHSSVHGHSRGQFVDAISIRERPAEVEDRARSRPLGRRSVARGRQQSRGHAGGASFALLHVGEGTGQGLVYGGAVLSQHVGQLPAELRRSLTLDRGLEMAQHKTFPMATDMQVYFCDPQSPWQRGTNENTNGLLRQYLPKKADLSRFTQSDLDKIALRLNQRPRETLGFETPASRLRASVASTP